MNGINEQEWVLDTETYMLVPYKEYLESKKAEIN